MTPWKLIEIRLHDFLILERKHHLTCAVNESEFIIFGGDDGQRQLIDYIVFNTATERIKERK